MRKPQNPVFADLCRAARAAGLGADLCCADRSTLLLSSSARVGQCRKHNTCAIEIA